MLKQNGLAIWCFKRRVWKLDNFTISLNHLAVTGDTNPGIDEEFSIVCRYLGLPDSLVELIQWNHDSHAINSSVISQTVKRFVRLLVTSILAFAGRQ